MALASPSAACRSEFPRVHPSSSSRFHLASPPVMAFSGSLFSGLHRTDLRFGVGNHRSELQRQKLPAVASYTLLSEKDGAAVLDFDQGRNDQPERR